MSLLPDRIRSLLADEPGLSEKKMFGGLCFLMNGNMACGITNKEQLMLRVGKERHEELLEKPGASEMDFTGRPMRGFLFVDPEGLTRQQLAAWVERALEFARTLPPK